MRLCVLSSDCNVSVSKPSLLDFDMSLANPTRATSPCLLKVCPLKTRMKHRTSTTLATTLVATSTAVNCRLTLSISAVVCSGMASTMVMLSSVTTVRFRSTTGLGNFSPPRASSLVLVTSLSLSVAQKKNRRHTSECVVISVCRSRMLSVYEQCHL
jgi:hypothetical protein